MKKKVTLIMVAAILTITLSVLAQDAFAKRCPGAYDMDDFELDQVSCVDEENNPTGEEKMDCVGYIGLCCNTSLQTGCSALVEGK